jgi:hypothetical protein
MPFVSDHLPVRRIPEEVVVISWQFDRTPHKLRGFSFSKYKEKAPTEVEARKPKLI